VAYYDLQDVAVFGAFLVLLFTRALGHKLALLGLASQEVARIQANRLQLGAIKTSDGRAIQVIPQSFIQGIEL
jgi:hypothetical protein